MIASSLVRKKVQVKFLCQYPHFTAQKHTHLEQPTCLYSYCYPPIIIHKLTATQSAAGGTLSLPGCCYRLLPLFKDAMYPVGLREQSSVAETHTQAQENPPERAHSHVWRRNHEESNGVTQEDSRQQHVAHLPSRSSHDGRVVVPHKGDDDERGADDAQHGDEDGHHGPGGVPLQLDDGNGNAAGAVDIRSHFIRTQFTGEL